MIETCRFAEPSDYDCGCLGKTPYRRCANERRAEERATRTDGAAFHAKEKDGAIHVRADYCNRTHCVDFEPMETCRFATLTTLKWAGDVANCRVVECRNPTAKERLKTFKDSEGRELLGVRKPCDEKFNLIPNADYLHVRSRYCNRTYCPYFTEKDAE